MCMGFIYNVEQNIYFGSAELFFTVEAPSRSPKAGRLVGTIGPWSRIYLTHELAS